MSKAEVNTTAFDALTTPELRIPFGAGFDQPTFVARGNVAQIKSQVQSFFGLKNSKASTAVELAVEAALYTHGLVNAATLGAEPKSDDESGTTPDEDPPARRSIAQKRRSGQPEDNTGDIESLVKGASSRKSLHDIYLKFKDSLTDEQLKLFSQRKQELAS